VLIYNDLNGMLSIINALADNLIVDNYWNLK